LAGDDCGFRPTGQIRLAENDAEFAQLEARAKLLCEHGFFHEELVDRTEARRIAPAAAPHVVGGLVCRDDGFADPFRTVIALKSMIQALGVQIYEHTRVIGLEQTAAGWEVFTQHKRFQAPLLVNCAGAWGDEVANWLGEPVPLVARGLMLMVTAAVCHFNDAVVGLAGRPLSFKQTETGSVVIGGALRAAADREQGIVHINLQRAVRSAQTVCEVFPILRNVPVLRCWGGIEGFMPDDLPVIGKSSKHDTAFHAFGFSAHGFQLAPIVGKVLAELILDGRSALPISPFSISRFDERRRTTGLGHEL
jgi:sarcosine oxidase subunit beta